MCTISFAYNPGQGSAPSSGQSTGGTHEVQNAYGYRITLGTSDPIREAQIPSLAYTTTAKGLEDHRTLIANINRTRYWQPGIGGLNFIEGADQNDDYSRNVHYAIYNPVDSTIEKYNYGRTNQHKRPRVNQDANSNIFAWQLYNCPQSPTRPTDSRYQYNQDLHDMFWGIGDYKGRDLTAQDFKAKFEAATGMNALNKMKEIFAFQPGAYPTKDVITELNDFSWDVSDSLANKQDSPYALAYWSQLGHMSTCWMLLFATMDTGNADYWWKDMFTKLMNWRASGYSADTMPVIVVESVSGTVASKGRSALYNVPMLVQKVYKNNNSPIEFFELWSKSGLPNPTNDIRDAIDKIVKGMGPYNLATAVPLRQGLMGYSTGGSWTFDDYMGTSADGAPARNYCMLVKAIAGEDEHLDGWAVSYAYYMDLPPTIETSNTKGSFTWELMPDGRIEKTPDKTVSESSTIRKLNISQSGYNDNNIKEWQATVNGDKSTDNKIRFNIYRVSEDLQKDVPANKWDRAGVLHSGDVVPNCPQFVQIGDGTVRGIPVINTLKSGEESRVLTDAEFLQIMERGTDLYYTETIAGALDPGMRVTYAVTVEVDIGGNGYWIPLSNNQAEWVEYRSEPGTYIYTSDDPDGYAEIKCGGKSMIIILSILFPPF